MTTRPAHIWLVLALLAAITLWLFYAIVAAATYFVTGGHPLRLMVAYAPAFVGACFCALAWVALYQRRRWVRWLFLLPVAITLLQLLTLAPYVLLAAGPIADPAAKASIFHILSGFLQPLIFFLVSAATAVSVFRYFRAAGAAPAKSIQANDGS